MQQDLLDMMMSAQDEVSGLGMSNADLVDEVITIMGAGHEVCKHCNFRCLWRDCLKLKGTCYRAGCDIVALLFFCYYIYQTTAVALSWCLFTLSNDQSVQERAREEVLSVLTSHPEGEDITLDNVDRMEYITAVCKETLR